MKKVIVRPFKVIASGNTSQKCLFSEVFPDAITWQQLDLPPKITPCPPGLHTATTNRSHNHTASKQTFNATFSIVRTETTAYQKPKKLLHFLQHSASLPQQIVLE